jgi:hypothetical protein
MIAPRPGGQVPESGNGKRIAPEIIVTEGDGLVAETSRMRPGDARRSQVRLSDRPTFTEIADPFGMI